MAFASGIAVLAFALLGPLDSGARDDRLTPHIAGHLLLGDAAAPLLLLGLPAVVRGRLGASLTARGRVIRILVSPPVALVAWATAMTFWSLPPIHRAAAPPGVVHVLDHASFLFFGLLVWLAVFDVRPSRRPGQALLEGGLPWWGCHLFAVFSRLMTIPAAVIIWFAPGFAVYPDQVDAASLLIGFEMFLFVFALIAGFIALAVNEGRRGYDASSGS